ncbi:MAG: alpha/beta hydrolase [Polyangiales bacterium]
MLTRPEEFRIKANGIEHHVLRWLGGDETIVLCHGFLDMAWSFEPLATQLNAAGLTVIAFDWRGHGTSSWSSEDAYYHFPNYVADLDRLVDKLAIDAPFHLLGHSMGGTACVYFAGTRPEKIRSLVLLEGLGPPEFLEESLPKRFASWLDGTKRVERTEQKALTNTDEALRRLRFQNPNLSDEFGRQLVAHSTRPHPNGQGLVWSFDPLHRTTSPVPFRRATFDPFLSNIDCPVLLVFGQNGYRLADETERARLIGHHEFFEIADAGHMLHRTHPSVVAERILQWLPRR